MTTTNEFISLIKLALNNFESIHGNSDHTAIVAAPANLTILGDHTHYNNGILISTRVNKYSVCIIKKRKDKTISFANAETGKYISSCLDFEVNNYQEFNLLIGLTKILCKKNIINSGFDCVIYDNIPNCFGLGKISSIQISFINAIKKIFSLDISEDELLQTVYENELNYVGKVSNRGHHFGLQFGKKNYFLSYDIKTNQVEHLRLFPENYNLIVVETDNLIEKSNERCNERVEECEIGVKNLRLYIWGIKSIRDIEAEFLLRHYHMIPQKIFNKLLYNVNERKRCFEVKEYIKKEKWNDFGELIKASHWSLSHDYEVSDEFVDFLVSSAIKIKGVIASKMISCSTISSTFNIVDSNYSEHFIDSIKEMYLNKYNKELKIYRLQTADGVKKIHKKILYNPV